MVSPLFGLSRWVAGHGIRSFGPEEEGQEELWGGKVATQRSDTAGFAFCMKGRINSEPNDSHSLWSKGRYSFSSLVQRQALRPLTVFTVGLCFQNEKAQLEGECYSLPSNVLASWFSLFAPLSLILRREDSYYCLYYSETAKNRHQLRRNAHFACLILFFQIGRLLYRTHWHHAHLLCLLNYQAVDTASRSDLFRRIHLTEQIGVKQLANSPSD